MPAILTTHRAHPDAEPLLVLGPGGDFTDSFHPGDDGRLRSDRSPRRTRNADAPDPTLAPRDRIDLSSVAVRIAALLAAERTLERQCGTLCELATQFAAERGRAVQSNNVGPIAATALPVPVIRSINPSSLRIPVAGLVSSHRVVIADHARFLSEGPSHEPHPQAAQDSPVDPRLPRPQWLFADDAGARRRDRREQGHGLRARRGPYQEGRAHPRSQQGSLFVDR